MKNKKQNKKVVVVLGMHRSGTSALMSLLNHVQLDIGNELLRPAQGVNDKGFWENKNIVNLHETILDSLGYSWDSIFTIDSATLVDKVYKIFKTSVTDLIKNEFTSNSIWGFKDPRTCRLLPLWLKYFNEANIEPVFLIIYRNPSEVAASLKKRDGFNENYSYALWTLHNLDSELYTREINRLFINFDNLVWSCKKTTNDINNFLKSNHIYLLFKDYGDIEKIIESKFKHHNKKTTHNSIVKDLYNNLNSLSDKKIMSFDNVIVDNLYSLVELFSSTREIYDGKCSDRITNNYEKKISKLKFTLDKTEKCYEQTKICYLQTNNLLSVRDEQLNHSHEHIVKLEKHIKEYEIIYKRLNDSLKEKDNEVKKNTELNIDLYNKYKELEEYSNNAVNELNLKYIEINEKNSDLIKYSEEYSKLNKELQNKIGVLNVMEKQLIDTTEYNKKLTNTHKEVEAAYLETINTLRARDVELTKNKKYTEQLTKAYEEAQTAYQMAIDYVEGKNKQIDETQELLDEYSSRIKRLEHIETMLRDPIEQINDNDLTTKSNASSANISVNNYEKKLDLRVVNTSHSKMYRLIEEDYNYEANKVLEVGCSTAFFGELLKKRGYEVWGIEIDPTAANVARTRIDQVYTGTIESFLSDPELCNLEFDYILLGDVIEHVVNPLKVLKDCKKILSPIGKFIISVPNVSHISVRTMLLEGRWEYSDCGILDRTHLHFFTRDSLVKLLSDAEISIEIMDATTVPGNDNENQDTPNVNHDIYSKTKSICNDFEQETLQFIIKCSPEENKTKIDFNNRFLSSSGPNIICLLPFEYWSIGEIRIRDPLTKYRAMYGGNFKVMPLDGWTPEDIGWADTIIFQRDMWPPILSLIENFQKLGKRIILDIDDLLTEVPDFLITHESCKQGKPYLIEAFHMADAVTVTTDILRDQIKKYTEHVYVIPNCVTTKEEPVIQLPDDSDQPVNLIIASQDTVRIDFISSALKKLAENDSINISFIGIGPPGGALKQEGVEVQWYPNVEYDHWKTFISEQDNTIGIIPLDDSVFSSCKSAIKYFDYSLAGIPSICSNVPPYSPVIENGKTGILCNNDEDSWYQSILELVNSYEKRQLIANNARDYVRSNYSLSNSAHAWRKMFDDTPASRGQLGSELSASLPKSKKLSNFAKLCVKPRKYKEALDLLISEGPSSVKNRISKHF